MSIRNTVIVLAGLSLLLFSSGCEQQQAEEKADSGKAVEVQVEPKTEQAEAPAVTEEAVEEEPAATDAEVTEENAAAQEEVIQEEAPEEVVEPPVLEQEPVDLPELPTVASKEFLITTEAA